MLVSGEFFIPHTLGWPFLDKPPLFYWVLALFFKLFSSYSEWVARLPGLLALVLTGWVNFLVVRKYVSKEAAILSSLFLLTAGDILFFASTNSGEIDLFYTLIVYLQIASIFVFYERRQHLTMFLASYLFTGLGFLTKGMPSLAFQMLTLTVFLLLQRRQRLLFSFKHLVGLMLCVGVVGSYFWTCSLSTEIGPFIMSILYDSSRRTVLASSPSQILVQVISFPFNLVVLLAPWSLVGALLIGRDSLNKIRSNRLVCFCALFLAVNVPFYWVSPGVRDRYLYPFFPFFMVLVAYLCCCV